MPMISRHALPLLLLAAVALAVPLPARAQQPPPFETTKITDNVYLFRYGGHQSMFVVTPDGVIATDPIAQRRPEAATTYLAEIRKITQAPIKYVVYSHHHYDHIEGGKPFKDAGATFIAHMNAKTRLEAVKKAQLAGKCFDTAMKEIKLAKYETWRNYDAYLPGNIERFCEFWGGGF